MYKYDTSPAGTAAGRFIDEAVARGPTALECGVEVRDAVADVMNAGSAFGKKLRHGARGVARVEHPDVDGTQVQADDRRSIGAFGTAGNQAEDVAIETECLVDAGHGRSEERRVGKECR